jgi:hypothetical protein
MNRKIPARGDTLIRRTPGTAITIAAIFLCTFLLTTCDGGGSGSGGGGTGGDFLHDVAWSGARLVVVGNNSTILTFE